MSKPIQNNDPGHTKTSPGAGSHVKFTILLWENDDLLREVLRRTLENSGHIVLQTATGEEAMDRFPIWAKRLCDYKAGVFVGCCK